MSEILKSWSGKYKSDIVSIHIPLFSFTVVSLNSYTAIKEALTSVKTSEALSGRPFLMRRPDNEERAGIPCLWSYEYIIFSISLFIVNITRSK